VDDRVTESTAAQAPGRLALISWPLRYYMLLMLSLVMMMSVIDRRIIEILISSIKRDLVLSDAELGFLGGLPFALVYATLCIPAARLGDNWSRGKVVGLAISFWSVATMLCGVAQNFVQLCLARVGVGAGEACGAPSGQALVGDLFPRKGRATAMSLYLAAVPVGTSIGYVVGAWALKHFDWRSAFLIVGIPGLIIGPMMLLTFPKIPKGMADGATVDRKPPPFLATIRELWSIGALRYILIGASLQSFVAAGIQFWIPTFMERTHHISGLALGTGLALATGPGSLIGHLAGGPILDLLGRRDVRRQILLPIVTVVVGGSCAAAAFLVPVDYVYLSLGLQIFFNGMFAAPLYAIVQTLAPAVSRATAAALLVFLINIVGLGAGPWLLGQMSDLLQPQFGAEALRTALLIATGAAIPAAIAYFWAGLTYRKDVAAAEERTRALSEPAVAV
jgi:MFS family permease